MLLEQVFDDPTNGRIINNRFFNGIFLILTKAALDDAGKEQLFRLLVLVAKKLIGVHGHIERFQTRQVDEVSRVESLSEANHHNTRILSDDLFLEFDGFLVQVKSTLDYLVKVPQPIVGRKHWSLATFGEKGDKVVKALANLPKQFQSRAKRFDIALVKQQKPWLQDTIDARDKINHFLDGGVDYRVFCVFKDLTTGSVHVPMWSPDQTVLEFMTITWSNLFRLCEDFFGLFLSLRLPDHLSVFRDNEPFPSSNSPWKLVARHHFE